VGREFSVCRDFVIVEKELKIAKVFGDENSSVGSGGTKAVTVCGASPMPQRTPR
jgi:hypothetical protein